MIPSQCHTAWMLSPITVEKTYTSIFNVKIAIALKIISRKSCTSTWTHFPLTDLSSGPQWSVSFSCRSQLLSAVGAVDMFSVEHEALVGHAEAALLAVEAVLVPGEAFVVHHVGAMAKPCSTTRNRTHTGTSVTRQHKRNRAVWVDCVFRNECGFNLRCHWTHFNWFQIGPHCSRIITVSDVTVEKSGFLKWK